MTDEELTADDNWCPDCGEPREACRCRVIAEEEKVSVPKWLLHRICGMVYATRGEQHRLDFVTDEEYGKLVSLRHSGHDSIDTVLTALGGK